MTTDYDVVTVKPFLRLTNPKLTDLERLIWEPWQDLALVACLRGETRNGKTAFIDIPKDTGMEKEAVFRDARQYMEEVAEISSMLFASKDLASNLGLDPDEEFPQEEDDSRLFVVSTKDKTNGASIITLHGVMENLNKRFTRYYIIPSSRHEIVVLPVMIKDRNMEMFLNELVRETNISHVKLSDWLGDHIYICEHGVISPIATPVGVIKE